jgi:hypothetical protein
MLSPRQSVTRERTSLDGLWRFAFDPDGVGRGEHWWSNELPGDQEMAVPASFNDIEATREARDHVGDVWYQRTLRVPRGWDGQRIVLRFDAATHRASAWVGDALVVEHEGGYTPFEADITDHVRAGEEARVTVVVNNELSWTSIPPGHVQQLDDGRCVQKYFHDFFNYAGLHRSVWLYPRPSVHVGDVTVTTTEIDGRAGILAYRVVVEGGEDHEVRVTVRDAAGAEVARGDGADGTIRWRSQIAPVVRETEDAGRLDLLGSSCLALTRTAMAADAAWRRRLAPRVGELADALGELADGPGERSTRQEAADRALEVARRLAAGDPPSEPEAVAAMVALRTVAADLMIFAGVDPEEADAAVREGTGEFRVPAPASAPRAPFGLRRPTR